MELNGIIATGGTLVLGIGAVWAFVAKILPYGVKYVGIARDALDLVDDVLDSLQDGKLEAAEISKVQLAAAKLRDSLKK